jgi:60 kDa SS-A/Ro ribonucleoprotein
VFILADPSMEKIMSLYASLFRPKATPQSEPLDARQVENSAGGYVFALDAWARLGRFLVLGSDAPTYYQSARALTRENAKGVLACLAEDAARTLARIVEVSLSGRAPKQDPAIFALALATLDERMETRSLAYAAVPKVCRTASHLFQFVATAKALGKGFGRGMKRAVASWYDDKPVEAIAYQAVKYRSREGFDHERLLDMARPDAHVGEPEYDALYRWMIGKEHDAAMLHPLVAAHVAAMKAESASELVPLIAEHRLPWEALPTWANADPEVWRAMLPHLGLTALIRNLGNMTRIGAIKPLDGSEQAVAARLADEHALAKARVHPLAILQAMAVYRSGRGVRGEGAWTPSPVVLDALDDAFYKAFSNVEPTGKRHLIGLDVSGSMGAQFGGTVLTCREATAALALVTMAVEPVTHVVGFTSASGTYGGKSQLTPLQISPRQRLTDAVAAVSGLPFGATDCALPMLYASAKRLKVDAFLVLTDNETWAGKIHPVEALRAYRRQTGIPAKLVVVGMTSTGFSIADPDDGGMLDVVGFDGAAPAVIADFLR